VLGDPLYVFSWLWELVNIAEDPRTEAPVPPTPMLGQWILLVLFGAIGVGLITVGLEVWKSGGERSGSNS
jgi:hypothetical protein